MCGVDASKPRRQGRQPVACARVTQNTFLNDSCWLPHLADPGYITVLSVLVRVPGNALLGVQGTSCSRRPRSHGSLRHPAATREGLAPAPSCRAELAEGRFLPLTFPCASQVTLEVKCCAQGKTAFPGFYTNSSWHHNSTTLTVLIRRWKKL